MMAPSTITALLRNTLFFTLLVTAVVSQDLEDCSSKEMCGKCIQTPGCQWCSKLSSTSKGKCYPATANLTTAECAKTTPEYVENPKNKLEIIENLNLTEANSEVNNSQNIVQLRPQKIKLRLRKGEPQNITVKYRQAKDYPVDLYYLMDLSNSMRDDKDIVAGLGNKIAEVLRNHTKQVRLGFGSYVDKVLLPYVDMSPAKLQEPCTGCITPFSFRNNLKLNYDANSFKEKVDDIKMSGNMDSPEGGFDALMQVMRCTDQIGWGNARRIIVFSTDAKFHSAGDGRLAGIIDRNDEQCHLNDEGEYTHYMKMDYPSIAQINKVAKEEQVNIIFAVSSYESLYKLLSKEIDSSSFGKLTEKSDNVVQLVEDQYLAITSKVEMKDNTESTSGALNIEYFVRCPGSPENTFEKNNSCHEMKEGNEIEFQLQVTLKKCPSERNFVIKAGTTQEKLEIEVEAICDCDCQKNNHPLRTEYALECNGAGTLVCGVCECQPKFIGDSCQCQKGKEGTSKKPDNSACIKDGEECSGNGYCDCGQCKCETDFVGALCQCDRRQCYPLNSDVPCSGRGQCDCDECKCDDDFTGDTCQCPVDEFCKAPGESEMCSGSGECVCGECKCKGGTSGRFCEDCPTCGSGKCQKYKDCVQYKGWKSGEINNKEIFNTNCSDIDKNIKKVDSYESELELGATLCTYNDDEDGCTFYFTYHFLNMGQNKDYKISYQEERTCPEPPNLLAIVGSVVATIVAIGLLTLILWKIITTIHDKKEFERFEEDIAKAQWSTTDCALYVSPSTTTENPAFKKT